VDFELKGMTKGQTLLLDCTFGDNFGGASPPIQAEVIVYGTSPSGQNATYHDQMVDIDGGHLLYAFKAPPYGGSTFMTSFIVMTGQSEWAGCTFNPVP
jgi:hypothetical protein